MCDGGCDFDGEEASDADEEADDTLARVSWSAFDLSGIVFQAVTHGDGPTPSESAELNRVSQHVKDTLNLSHEDKYRENRDSRQ